MKEIVFSGILDDYKKKDSIWITWYITHLCNYNCYYCPINGNDHYNMNIYKDIIDYVYRKSIKYKNLMFSITGGEPSLVKEDDLITILHYFKNRIKFKKVLFRYQTNLSNTVEYYSNLWEILHDFKIIISTTLHINSDIDVFIDKIKRISKENIDVDVRIPIPSKYKEESIRRYKYVKKVYPNIRILPKYINEIDIVDNKYLNFIFDENEKILKEQNKELIYDVIYFDSIENRYIKKRYNRDMFLYFYKNNEELKHKKNLVLCDMSRNREILPNGNIYKCPNDVTRLNDKCICPDSIRFCCDQVPKINVKYIDKIGEIINES